MPETVSGHIVAILEERGIDTVFGLPRDGINGLDCAPDLVGLDLAAGGGMTACGSPSICAASPIRVSMRRCPGAPAGLWRRGEHRLRGPRRSPRPT